MRQRLYDKNQGINAFVFCARFPGNSNYRILGPAIIYPILNCLYFINSLDPRVDLQKHPKFFVVFDNSPTGENGNNQRLLIEYTKKFLTRLASDDFERQNSDLTMFGMVSWAQIKFEVCKNEAYKEKSWFKDLSKDNQDLINEYKELQTQRDIKETFFAPISATK